MEGFVLITPQLSPIKGGMAERKAMIDRVQAVDWLASTALDISLGSVLPAQATVSTRSGAYEAIRSIALEAPVQGGGVCCAISCMSKGS